MTRLSQKQAGAYYTPDRVVSSLVQWAFATRATAARSLLRRWPLIASHRNSVGVEQDTEAAAVAKERAPGGTVHEAEFLRVGGTHPQAIRMRGGQPAVHSLPDVQGEVRRRALELCASLGAKFSGLTASWLRSSLRQRVC